MPFFADPEGVSKPVFLLACAVFGAGLVLGGSGGSFGDVAVQLLSLPLIVLAALQWAASRPRARDWAALGLIAGILVLAMVQLAPLPLSVWSALPGRAELLQQMRVVGVTPGWTSLSLNPYATERALQWTLPAIAMYLAVRWMSPRQHRVLVSLLMVGAVLMTVMDVLFRGGDQNADVTTAALMAKAYQATTTATTAAASKAGDTTGSQKFMTGLFSNHNHFGTFLAMTIPLMAAMALGLWQSRKRIKPRELLATLTVLGLAALALLVAAFETHSRAALLLGGMAMIGCIGLLPWLGLGRRLLWTIGGSAIAAVVVATVTAGSGTFSRFGNGVDNDLRWQIHATTLAAARHFGPMGSGLGTFVEAYQAVSPEKDLLPEYINRAHGDYHELWLETGIPGAILIAGFFVWFLWSALELWTGNAESTSERPSNGSRFKPAAITLMARAAALSVSLLLIHSYVDYPLRKTAILVVFGTCCALMARPEPPKPAPTATAPAGTA